MKIKDGRFELHTTKAERLKISRLARRLKMTESDAIRRAVVIALQFTDQHFTRLSTSMQVTT